MLLSGRKGGVWVGGEGGSVMGVGWMVGGGEVVGEMGEGKGRGRQRRDEIRQGLKG